MKSNENRTQIKLSTAPSHQTFPRAPQDCTADPRQRRLRGTTAELRVPENDGSYSMGNCTKQGQGEQCTSKWHFSCGNTCVTSSSRWNSQLSVTGIYIKSHTHTLCIWKIRKFPLPHKDWKRRRSPRTGLMCLRLTSRQAAGND